MEMILVVVAAVPPAVVPALNVPLFVSTAPLVMIIWAKPLVLDTFTLVAIPFVVPATLNRMVPLDWTVTVLVPEPMDPEAPSTSVPALTIVVPV